MARHRSSGRRNDYDWLGICGVMTGLDLAVGSAVQGSTRFDASSSSTLMRTRGEILVQLDAAAVDERSIIALGLIKVKTAAAVAGVASIPTPSTESAADWLWHGWALVTSGAEAAVVNDQLVARLTVDSKAMRKLKADESVVLVAEACGGVDQGGTVDIIYGLRILTAA